MKRAIIFCNGARPSPSLVQTHIKSTDTIICADGGTKHAVTLGYSPQIIIGDQDSLPQLLRRRLLKAVTFLTYPPEKDHTDGELAVSYAVEQGFDEIILFGMDGSRYDHFLGLLLHISTLEARITIVTNYQGMMVVHNSLKLSGQVGDYVSLIPLRGDVMGITTTGLKYPLTDGTLRYGRTRGVSNELTQKRATITVKKGSLLVIYTQREKLR